MIDQLIIEDKASFTDFYASIAERKIKNPPKKSIKETVPFSNITYDFSAIHGEIYWEEREIEYIFEITAESPEKLEEKKHSFISWIMGINQQKLHDPHIPNYHFLATYKDMSSEDDEGLDKSTLTVTFTAYPYMIANTPKIYESELPASAQSSIRVLNESDHPVSLTVKTNIDITLQYDIDENRNITAAIPQGEQIYRALKLQPGFTTIELINSQAIIGLVRISYNEEVF